MVRRIGGLVIVSPTPLSPNKKSTTTTTSNSTPRRFLPNMLKLRDQKERQMLKHTQTQKEKKQYPKPWEIKAQAKADSERKEKIRKREAEAQLRMQKIKDEIDAIKEKEKAEAQAEANSNIVGGGSETTAATATATATTTVTTTTTTTTTTTSANKPPQAPSNASVHKKQLEAEYIDLEIEEELAELAKAGRTEQFDPLEKCTMSSDDGSLGNDDIDADLMADELLPRHLAMRVVDEMNISFARLCVLAPFDEPVDQTLVRPSIHATPMPPPVPVLILASPEPPRRRELKATPSGKLRRISSKRLQSNRQPPSNLVPEMRRRATPRDLQFDNDYLDPPAPKRKSNKTASTSNNVTTTTAPCSPIKEKQEDSIPSSSVEPSSTATTITPDRTPGNDDSLKPQQQQQQQQPQQQPQEQEQEQEQEHEKEQNIPNATAPVTPIVPVVGAVSPPPQPKVSTFMSLKKEKMDAKVAAKREEEKKQLQEQRAKLEQAKEHFQKGHDLCWKFQDSASALAEYRKALFVRESLLGKYHEDTGRTYFWIGRSLVKLKEREEALMAFSRALRIFDRVLMKNHKYNKWACAAMESVLSEMMAEAGGGDDDGEDSDFEAYKAGLYASIAHERAGDSCRKKGQLAQAIAEYRTAIDTMDEEYHPDAADLYCKVAIILRQQGEFDRALEEYRFASEIYELSLGAEHPETVKTLNQLIEKKRLNQVSMALMEKLNLGK